MSDVSNTERHSPTNTTAIRCWNPRSAEVDLGDDGMISLYGDGEMSVTIGERVFNVHREQLPVGAWRWVVAECLPNETKRLVPR